jgi:hypothetical protein
MPVLSGSAFHFLTNSGIFSTPYGGIIPDPVELPVSQVYVDGKLIEVTATSGQLQYLIVEPGDYPLSQIDRDKINVKSVK